MGGKLEGEALEGVKELYLAMGCEDEGVRMVLNPADPSNKDRWEKGDGRWRMKKYAGTLLHGDIASMNRSDAEKALDKGKT